MKLRTKLTTLVVATSLVTSLTAEAVDIDLFRAEPDSVPAPNILFMLDNSANMDAILSTSGTGTSRVSITKSDVIHNSLFEVLTDPILVSQEDYRVGVMDLARSNSPKGGTVTARVNLLDNTWSSILAARIKEGGVSTGRDILPRTNNRPFALTFNEAFLYFKGEAARSGLRDGIYSSTNTNGYDPLAVSGSNYISPVATGENCARNIIIFIANGHPDAGEDTEAEGILRSLGGIRSSDPIRLSPSNDQSNWADEYARFMAGYDFSTSQSGLQNVITFVVDVFNPDDIRTDVDRAARAYLKSIATQGKGQYFTAKNQSELSQAIRDILAIVKANDSAYASSTLPVSVNVRGTNLNQVYMGVFRPDETWRSRWMGNLKLYKLALDQNGSVYLADANGRIAEDRTNGFILSSAVSHWTHDDSVNFWDFNSQTYTDPSESPDGGIVEKGAAAQALRNDVLTGRAAGTAYDDTRHIYTCTTADCGTLTKFEATTDIASLLQLNTSTPSATDLVDWVYGKNYNPTSNPVITDAEGARAARASIHGDVLHSRPAVISYDSTDTNIRAYYGANDGIFHALKGGTALTDGHEQWGFIPYELLPRLKELYLNNPIETYGKPYFMDGSIGVLREADTTGNLTRVVLYVTMRRGGRSIYAIDATSTAAATDTAPPFRVLWTRNSGSDGYTDLGYTWSEPKLATIRNSDNTTRKVLFFGGGYDPTFDDTTPRSATAATMGRNIFAVDAETGNVIWTAASYMSTSADAPNNFEQVYPIPSDVSLVDVNKDGIVDRLYVGDTGGNLWRVNIGFADSPSSWHVKKLASVGSTHKFLYAPDVVKIREGVYGVLIGSGDRENPNNVGVSITSHDDYFFMFKDKDADPDSPTNNLTLDLLEDATDTATVIDINSIKGWYITLQDGEKVVSSSVTLNGITFFNTNQIGNSNYNPLTCDSTLGIARVYAVSYKDATAAFPIGRATELAGGGLPPSPVAAMTELRNPTTGQDELVETVIVGPTPIKVPGPVLGRRTKNYWFKNFD